MATVTLNPDQNSGGTTAGAYIGRNNKTETWATIRGTADFVGHGNFGGNGPIYLTTTTSPKYSYLYRVINSFNTSVLGANAIIDSAILSIYVVSKSTQIDANETLDLTQVTPASYGTFVGADSNQFQTTLWATAKAISGISTSAYADYTLNAAGIAGINKTTPTAFGLWLGRDRTNTEPTWSSASQRDEVVLQGPNEANPPKLVITYHLELSSGHFYFM